MRHCICCKTVTALRVKQWLRKLFSLMCCYIRSKFKSNFFSKLNLASSFFCAAAKAAGDDVSEEWKPLCKITPLTEDEQRLDYIYNNDARLAIQNLRRAKDSLKIVVNAVARGELPGSKEG